MRVNILPQSRNIHNSQRKQCPCIPAFIHVLASCNVAQAVLGGKPAKLNQLSRTEDRACYATGYLLRYPVS